MDGLRKLLIELAHTQQPLSSMDETAFLGLFKKHGLVVCAAEPIGWANQENIQNASETGVIGVGADKGSVVYDGNTWSNADSALYCAA